MGSGPTGVLRMRSLRSTISAPEAIGGCWMRTSRRASTGLTITALMERVRCRVKDKRVSALVKAFLKAGILTELGENRSTTTGTPQGGGATRKVHVVSGSRWLEVRLMPGT